MENAPLWRACDSEAHDNEGKENINNMFEFLLEEERTLNAFMTHIGVVKALDGGLIHDRSV